MIEPRRVRWRRRAQTIPMMLGVTLLATFAVPIALPAMVLADLVRGRRRLPLARVYGFALQYLINDSVEILLAGPYWLAAGIGTRLSSPASIRRHQRLQQWSIELLERRAQQLLGLRVEISPTDRVKLTGDHSCEANGHSGEANGSPAGQAAGSVIVLSRHVSLFDASLPGLLYHRAGYGTRGIIMAELLADPGFDLLYGRLGSVFIPRDGGEAATNAIARMVKGADDRTAYVLFPEGRLFRPGARDRALARLTEADPDRAEQLEGLRHVLPPRPGGFVTLLEALPEADVVLLDHRGLDRYRRLADFTTSAPVCTPVTVTVQRFPRSELPIDKAAQVRWLDERWLALDRDLTVSA